MYIKSYKYEYHVLIINSYLLNCIVTLLHWLHGRYKSHNDIRALNTSSYVSFYTLFI